MKLHLPSAILVLAVCLLPPARAVLRAQEAASTVPASKPAASTSPATKPARPLDALSRLGADLKPTRIIPYKKIGKRQLQLHIFEPEGLKSSDKRGCFVTFHGGGWSGGNPTRFYPFADYFAKSGMIGISVQYTLISKMTTPFDSVKDGRSAVRYLRAHAGELGIDPEKIVVSGGSAGGHVAAGTALFSGIDSETDDVNVSSIPNAMVLYYPVIDTSPEGYGNEKCGEKWQEISPLHQVKPQTPPTLVFHGTADKTTPFNGAKLFQEAMEKSGNRCELVAHEGGKHGYLVEDPELFDEGMGKTAEFLRSLNLVESRLNRDNLTIL